jgi:hypothetical protein
MPSAGLCQLGTEREAAQAIVTRDPDARADATIADYCGTQ